MTRRRSCVLERWGCSGCACPKVPGCPLPFRFPSTSPPATFRDARESRARRSNAAPACGYKTLFAGLTGNGKTMAAKVMGSDLERDVYRTNLLDVVSKWVDETEKNLRRVSDAAEEGVPRPRDPHDQPERRPRQSLCAANSVYRPLPFSERRSTSSALAACFSRARDSKCRKGRI